MTAVVNDGLFFNTTKAMKEQYNFSLLPFNTFGIEAHCRKFVELDDVQEAQRVLPRLEQECTPVLVIGRGSNLLLTSDYDGVVLRSAIGGMQLQSDTDGQVTLRCGSGLELDSVIACCVRQGWYGMENLSLIPGDVGASAVQNVGAYGVEAQDVIEKVEAVETATGKKVVFSAEDCHYAYRDSIFKHEENRGRYFITHVTYRLSRSFIPVLHYGNLVKVLEDKHILRPTAEQVRDTVIEIRRAKLPDWHQTGSAGSFFKNPLVTEAKATSLLDEYPQMPHFPMPDGRVKLSAGWMIEQCGWKGRKLGRAGVYDKQALVLVNLGGATGSEVLELCRAVVADVERKFGITLHPEVNIV